MHGMVNKARAWPPQLASTRPPLAAVGECQRPWGGCCVRADRAERVTSMRFASSFARPISSWTASIPRSRPNSGQLIGGGAWPRAGLRDSDLAFLIHFSYCAARVCVNCACGRVRYSSCDVCRACAVDGCVQWRTKPCFRLVSIFLLVDFFFWRTQPVCFCTVVVESYRILAKTPPSCLAKIGPNPPT